jgi:hypothetical protein
MEDLHNNKEAGENIIDTIGDAVKDFLGLEDEPNKEVDKRRAEREKPMFPPNSSRR